MVTRTGKQTLTVNFTTESGTLISHDFEFGPEVDFITRMTVVSDAGPIIEHSFIPGVDDPNWVFRFINACLANAPDSSWDRDQSGDSTVLEYIRYLESQVLKYRGCLEEHEHATEHEIPGYLAAGFIAKACTDLQQMYARSAQEDDGDDPNAKEYCEQMSIELEANLRTFHKFMGRITPTIDRATRDSLIVDAFMKRLGEWLS